MRHSDSRYDTFPKRKEHTHGLVKHSAQAASMLKPFVNISTYRQRKLGAILIASVNHPQTKPARPARERPKSFTDKEDFDVLIFRQKSARPSSRWETRLGDEIGNDESDELLHETQMLRPKSGRPDSRMVRHTELVDESDFVIQPTPPPRPTTSRGRRKPKENRDVNDIYVIFLTQMRTIVTVTITCDQRPRSQKA